MHKKPLLKLLSVYLIVSTFMLTLPAHGWAMFIPSGQESSSREADLENIQKALESSIMKQRLMDYGLSPEEAMARISTLSPEQVHQFSSQIDSLQPGADGFGALIFVLLVAIVVVIVLQATGHKIIIK